MLFALQIGASRTESMLLAMHIPAILYGRLQNALSFGLKSTPGMPAEARLGVCGSLARQNVATHGLRIAAGRGKAVRLGDCASLARRNVATHGQCMGCTPPPQGKKRQGAKDCVTKYCLVMEIFTFAPVHIRTVRCCVCLAKTPPYPSIFNSNKT